MSDDPEGLVTLAEAARRLRRDPEGLRALIRRGKLTAKRGNDGRLLVRLADLPAERSTGLAAAAEGRPADLPAGLPDRVEAELWDRLVAVEADRDRLRDELMAARERAAGAEREVRVLREAWEREKARADELAADARRPWWRKLLG
jgi:hypothetical protein